MILLVIDPDFREKIRSRASRSTSPAAAWKLGQPAGNKRDCSVLDQGARLRGLFGVSRFAAFLDFANDALAVDHKGHPLGNSDQGVEDTVLLRHRLRFVAEHREGDAELGGECLIALRRVYADADNLRAGLLEFGDISLIRLKLLPSPWREGPDVERQHHGPLPAKVAEAHGMAALVVQYKVWRQLADTRWACSRGAGR